MVIDGLESEITKEREKSNIKLSLQMKSEQQLKLELENWSEEMEDLKKNLTEKDKLIAQNIKEVEAAREKCTKCDTQRSLNQKELTKSRTTCQSVSTRNSKLDGELRELKSNHSTMSKQYETLQKTLVAKDGTISELNNKIQELKLHLESQKEINRRLTLNHLCLEPLNQVTMINYLMALRSMCVMTMFALCQIPRAKKAFRRN